MDGVNTFKHMIAIAEKILKINRVTEADVSLGVVGKTERVLSNES